MLFFFFKAAYSSFPEWVAQVRLEMEAGMTGILINVSSTKYLGGTEGPLWLDQSLSQALGPNLLLALSPSQHKLLAILFGSCALWHFHIFDIFFFFTFNTSTPTFLASKVWHILQSLTQVSLSGLSLQLLYYTVL